jgi:type IV secretory pathway VirB10-like protein
MPTDVEKHDDLQHTHSAKPHFWIVTRHSHSVRYLIVAVLLLCMLFGMWMYCHQEEPAPNEHVASSVEISSRLLVPELKIEPEDLPAKEPEIATITEHDDLRDERIKSSIIAHDESSGVADLMGKGKGKDKDADAQRGPQDRNSLFAKSVTDQGVAVSTARSLGGMPYKVLQGKMIEAVLEPRAISDLPGMVCATVQHDVFGMQKRQVLIPWGSRVCGQYSAEMRKGQERLFVVWNMLRRPDGVEVALESGGADQLGTAGMGGAVDTHFAKIFGVSSLLSIINVGSSSMHRGSSREDRYQDYYRDAVTSAAAQTAQQALEPYLSIPPTVVVPPGARIRIYVNRDLDFTAVYQKNGNEMQTSDIMIYE